MSRKFAAFERAGWERVADAYDAGFAGLTRQAVEPLLDAAAVGSGSRVLDLATGPGYVAAAAARRGARVLGIDFSSAMVALARTRVPAAEFREGDAERLELEDAAFDAVVMNFGLLHLSRPERALAEAARVLCPGGRVALTVWAPPEEAVGFGIVLEAVGRFGDLAAPLPEGPPFFRFSDPAACADALRAASFDQPAVTRVAQTWRLGFDDELFEIMLDGTVRTAALLRAQTPDALREIRREVATAAAAWRRGPVIELPMPAVLASGVRSG